MPNIDDPAITYPNLDTGVQRCKLIETCVLYVDIRRSTELNFDHRRGTLAKLYSSFIRGMARAAEFHGGKVRSIIGDRLMVIFDKPGCYDNALDTAILMNSIADYVINKHFSNDTVKCGIGIDYGKMLASKVGVIKQGSENATSKSLVWLGKPANVASKLTDLANKSDMKSYKMVNEGFCFRSIGEYAWQKVPSLEFIDHLENTYSRQLKHSDENFFAFHTTREMDFDFVPPILMTAAVWEEFKRLHPSRDCVKKGWFKKIDVSIPGHSHDVYGGNVIKTVFRDG